MLPADTDIRAVTGRGNCPRGDNKRMPATILTRIKVWVVILAMNCINRSMGQPDLYPFVLSPSVIDKLGYIGNLIHAV
jgi:hypothetical protein